MSTSFPGHGGQPQEPQCYNCGAAGHWAIACPEPTRETPAGLAAWRSSSGTNQGHGKSHNAGSKKAKGPIITKYAPPPPPQPSSFNTGMGHYPPPLPVNHPPHQPPGLYPGPSPPYQQYGPPPPAYPPGYHQPAYGYASGQYAPPAPPVHYGQPPPYSPSGYMAPLPGPPPPPDSYSHLRSNAPEYRPPPPPPSRYHQPYPPSSSYVPRPPSHSPKAASVPPSNVRPEVPPPRPAPTPPKSLPARISHPLPPKPPPSLDQMKSHRDHKSRRKHDRQHNHQEKRHKDHKPNSRPQRSSSPYEHHRRTSSAGRHPPKDLLTHKSPTQGATGHSHPEEPTPMTHTASKSVDQTAAVDAPNKFQAPKNASNDSTPVASGANGVHSANNGEAKLPPRPDTVDHPNLEGDKEESSLPLPARVGQPDSAEYPGEDVLAKSPIVEKEDGEISNEMPSDETYSKIGASPSSEARALGLTDDVPVPPALEDQTSRKRGHSVEEQDEERRSKKHKSDSTVPTSDKAGQQESGPGSDLWDVLKVPRQVDRKRRDSAGSRGSRHSSISSKSSDLNSLEAELLGRSTKQKQREPSPAPKQRQDRKAPLKGKRRQQNSNSAYSRRW